MPIVYRMGAGAYTFGFVGIWSKTFIASQLLYLKLLVGQALITNPMRVPRCTIFAIMKMCPLDFITRIAVLNSRLATVVLFNILMPVSLAMCNFALFATTAMRTSAIHTILSSAESSGRHFRRPSVWATIYTFTLVKNFVLRATLEKFTGDDFFIFRV